MAGKRAPAKKAAGKKCGQPQLYDRAKVTKAICDRLATGKEPMTVICASLGVPVKTVNDWRLADPEIRRQFDEARDLGYDAIARDCIEIADDGRRDYQPDKDGREVVDHDHIQRSKLRIETRLKLLARWDPKRYGEKVQLADAEGNKLPARQMSDEELMAILAREQKAQGNG